MNASHSLGGDFHVFVRLVHGASGVFLRAAAGPADHFRDQVFESRRGHTMVRFIDPGIRVQSRVDHDAVNEVIDDAGDWVDAAEALVKCGGWGIGLDHIKLASIFHGIWRLPGENSNAQCS